jgi:hypothetical protein
MPNTTFTFPLSGLNPEDLGQVECSPKSSPDLFLISDFKTPVLQGAQNRYSLIVSDAAVRDKVEIIQWTIKEYKEKEWTLLCTGQLTMTNELKKTWLCLSLRHTFQTSNRIRIAFKISGTGLSDRELTMEQYVRRPSPWRRHTQADMEDNDHQDHQKLAKAAFNMMGFETSPLRHILPFVSTGIITTAAAYLNQKAKVAINSSLVGNREIVGDLADLYFPAILFAYRWADIDSSRVPIELLVSVLFQQMTREKRKSRENVTDSQIEDLGLSRLRLGAIAMVLGTEGFQGPPHINWKLRKKDLLIAESELGKGLRKTPLHVPLEAIGDSDGSVENKPTAFECVIFKRIANNECDLAAALQFLATFPRVNILITYRILCHLKSRRFQETTEVELLAEAQARSKGVEPKWSRMSALAAEFMKVSIELNGWNDASSVEDIPENPGDLASDYSDGSAGDAPYVPPPLTDAERTALGFGAAATEHFGKPYTVLIIHGGLGARNVTAIHNGKHVLKIDDPVYRDLLYPFLPNSVPVWDSHHFGWQLKRDIEDPGWSVPDEAAYWECVFIDAGFWGHYDRGNPQRDFGLIEKGTVWQCRLAYEDKDVAGIHGETLWRLRLIYDGPSIIESLATELYESWGYAIELVSTTDVRNPPSGTEIPMDRAVLVLPDMHLPEKWPDLLPESRSHSNASLRRNLRRSLVEIQRDSTSSCGTKPEVFQGYIQRIILADPEIPPFPFSSSEFDASQFEVDFSLVERKIRVDNSWFYPPLCDNDPYFTTQSNLAERAADLPTSADGIVIHKELQGDPAPAIDLAALLLSVQALDRSKVMVLQVGDLMETWMGNEFLYRDFPGAYQTAWKAAIIELLSDMTSIQYRLDKQWRSFPTWDHPPFSALFDSNYPNVHGTLNYVEETATTDRSVATIVENFARSYKDYESEDKKCILLAAYHRSFGCTPLTIATFNEANELLQTTIDDPDDELVKELQKAPTSRNTPSIIERLCSTVDHVPRGWYLQDSIRLHVQNRWPVPMLGIRYKTGRECDDLDVNDLRWTNQGEYPTSVLQRAQTLLHTRLKGVLNFALPLPAFSGNKSGPYDQTCRNTVVKHLTAENGLLRGYEEPKDDALVKRCTCEFCRGNGAFLWNKLVLDLLEAVGCTMVQGNHDCYRGDPLLLTSANAAHAAVPWYSGNGLFAEHEHRWDPYNQDGCAFGPGVTNQVHYVMRPFTQRLDKAKARLIPRRHTETIPCCAQWFLLAHGRRSGPYRDGGRVVEPFGVYAVGHSHSPDLLKIMFRKERL